MRPSSAASAARRDVKIKLPENLPVPLRDPTERARVLRAVRVALEFLTIIPVRWGGAVTDADVAAARYAFPVVGAAIGLALAGLSEALGYVHAAPLLASFLLVAAGAAITGGLHLDGLADSSDGLFLWGDADRRLTAMRDPHVGSFGLLAIVLVVVGKFAVLSTLVGNRRALDLLGAAAVSRTLILVAAGLAPYARPQGTGQVVVEATTVTDSLWSVVAALVLGAVLAGEAGLVASAAALLVAWTLSHIANQRLGGVTGDILGAVVELGELAYLVVLGLFASI
jgi:adenosylcobinamide-GDP ribazoletransferase